MKVVETLIARNLDFAADRHEPNLRMMPSLKRIVIGCGPRVDPTEVLCTMHGEVAAIRNGLIETVVAPS